MGTENRGIAATSWGWRLPGRLKGSLRNEINEAQWASLYSTKSYPFEPPASGKIAVKVINHYRDEVLKVYRD
jgi:adenine-specific DNA-methyltransferase